MSIITVDIPQAAVSERQRFTAEDAEAARVQVMEEGAGASDGVVYKSAKAAQQAAWELRHAIAGLYVDGDAERKAWLKEQGVTSKALADMTFVVYKRR